MSEPALEAVMTEIVDDLFVDVDPETNYYNWEQVASSEYYTLDQYNSTGGVIRVLYFRSI